VLHNNRRERVRLNGIDCPEKGQAFGKRAKQAASELVFGKKVALETHGRDIYGRTIAEVLLPDGVNVNLELVRNGWCWWYQQYAPDNVILAELQRRARHSGIGLWADADPMPPWQWRKHK
jgi:micrococcal nuclease